MQLAERPERGPPLREPRTGPAEEVALAGRRRHRRERSVPARTGWRPGSIARRTSRSWRAAPGRRSARAPAASRPPFGIAGDERLGQGDEDGLPLGPAACGVDSRRRRAGRRRTSQAPTISGARRRARGQPERPARGLPLMTRRRRGATARTVAPGAMAAAHDRHDAGRAGRSCAGRSQPCAGHGSQRIGRSSR